MYRRRLATNVRGRGFGTGIAGPNGVAAVAADGLVWGWDAASLSLAPTFGVGTPTITRAGNTATRVNSSGLIEVVNADLPRFTYNPSTLALQGLLVEEARTNFIRNNSTVGASAGSPGTLPNNWTVSGSGAGGLTRTISLGTERGIPYIDIRLSGTSSGGVINIVMDSSNAATVQNDVWAMSVYAALVAGSTTGLSGWGLRADVYSSVPAYLQTIGNDIAAPVLGGVLVQNRFSVTATVTNASAANLTSRYFQVSAAAGPIDFTIRLGYGQWEKAGFASSVIPTTTATVTRNADVITLPTASITGFSSSALTLYADAIPVNATLTGLGEQQVVSIDDATANERHYIRKTASAATAIGLVDDGGANQATLSAGTWVANTAGRIAMAVAANNSAASFNGGAVATDATVTMPTVTTLRIGSSASGASFWNAPIRKLRLYNVRKNNAQLVAMTAAS